MANDGHSAGSRHLLADAKSIGRKHGARGCIIILFDSENFAGASYGTTASDCGHMKNVLDEIADQIAEGKIPPPW